jgi:phospholipid/cholesterol/gamma-HCH transport system substrate-binding protein
MREQEARERAETGQAGIARVIAIAALAAGVLLTTTALFGGDSGHSYKLLFETGGQLVPGNEVLVAGQAIGTVDEIGLTDDGQAEVEVSLDQPLHEGTTAQIRLTSLSGIANRYIALQMGPDSGAELPDGATLAADQTKSPVDLDQLFNTFDHSTRSALQDVFAGQATIYAGREEEANRSYRFLAPGLNSTERLLAELNRDSQAFEEFLVSGSRILGSVAERRNDLSSLTSNANEALGAIARENSALDRTLAAFAPAMRQANTTFVNLRAALDDLDPLVATTAETTEDLTPFLRRLRVVAERAVPVVGDLRDVVDRGGANNDLADALADLPRAAERAGEAVPRALTALNQTQDEVEFARPYTPDLLGFITNVSQISAYYDGSGHYARIQPVGANLFDRNEATGVLEPITAAQQFDGYTAFGLGPFTRCPGAATQPIPGSNPFLDDGNLVDDADCDDDDVIPGP